MDRLFTVQGCNKPSIEKKKETNAISVKHNKA